MIGGDLIRASQIRDGASNFQDPVISTSAEVETNDCLTDQFDSSGIKTAMLFEETRSHLVVAANRALFSEPLLLNQPCMPDPFTDSSGALLFGNTGQLVHLNCRNLNMDIDPVEQRPG